MAEPDSNQASLTPRPKLERNLMWGVYSRGVSVCVQGTPRSGKTTLVLGYLQKEKIPYIYCKITQGMTWPEFTQALLNQKVRQGPTEPDKDTPALGQEGWCHDSMDISNVRHLLQDKNAALVLDDFHNASDDLNARVADLCKSLVTYLDIPEFAKVIAIGNREVAGRLYDANHSLEQRLTEIKVHALPGMRARQKPALTPAPPNNQLDLGL